MIHIEDKKNCCGCSSCVQVCPVSCISMHADAEGFLYPNVDEAKCIDCGLCEKVCPFIETVDKILPLRTSAVVNKDNVVRLQSSSGGVFSVLAESIIREGGVVFGVKFNNKWQPVFDYTETMDGIIQFRGSKYVQAVIGQIYKTVKFFLKSGRKVLFTGTPCQIAGLKRFLKIEYVNLLVVEVVCHGVPSPLVWGEYLNGFIKPGRREGSGKNTVLSSSKDIPVITGISFRDKKLGWKKYSFVVQGVSDEGRQNSVLLSNNHSENPFMRIFLGNLILRPSCYACRVKAGRSLADMSIADYWGVSRFHPELDDDLGTSLVLVYSQKGFSALEAISDRMTIVNTEYENALKGNPSIESSVPIPKNRRAFWKKYNEKGLDAIYYFSRKLQPSLYKRFYSALRRYLGRAFTKYLKK